MNVPSVSSTGGSAATKAATKTGADYQSFLKLLVAQMKNQDPTDPADPTQFVAQLATFSQVEQSVQTNSKLDQLLQSSALAQADSVIGHAITSADGTATGIAKSVKLGMDGLVAVLANGSEIAITNGVVIGETASGGTR